jgi:hypothetical protein
VNTKGKIPFAVAIAEPVTLKLPAEAHPDGEAGLVTPQEYANRTYFGQGSSYAQIRMTTCTIIEP